jgi:nicotinamide mononucleotide transporter
MLEMTLYTPLNFIGLFGVLFYSANFVAPELSLAKTLVYAIPYAIVGTFVLYLFATSLHKKWPIRFPKPSTPWLDAATTSFSFVATVLLILWSPATWVFWVAINFVAIYVFWKNKAYIVMGSYVFYLINAIRGLLNWTHSIDLLELLIK